jgi:hypothetical protein
MSDQSLTQHGANRIGAGLTGPGQTSLMLVGLGLATWMEFHTHDAVNLVLPDISASFGVSQDEASWLRLWYLHRNDQRQLAKRERPDPLAHDFVFNARSYLFAQLIVFRYRAPVAVAISMHRICFRLDAPT